MQGWLGWAIFSRVFRPSQKAAKRRKHFPQGPSPTPPPPYLLTPYHPAFPVTFPDLTKLRATFGDRVFISATGNKHKIQRWRGVISPSPMYFKVCGHYLHALTGNNLIQESLVTFLFHF